MFKNLNLYYFHQPMDYHSVERAFFGAPFIACGPTQEKSSGFHWPRGINGAMLESIAGHWIAKYVIETRSVPADQINKRADEIILAIKAGEGREPGAKERREIKEQAKQELLPKAFPKQSHHWVWIDNVRQIIAIDASSPRTAEAVLWHIRLLLYNLPLLGMDSIISAQESMALWLKEQEAPAGFSVDRECELKAADESKAVVKYGRHPLDIDEVKAHIQAGKLPTKLAMTWDSRVSFVLTEGLQIKKLDFLDTVFDGQAHYDGGFDADVAIATGELSKLIPALIEALGG